MKNPTTKRPHWTGLGHRVQRPANILLFNWRLHVNLMFTFTNKVNIPAELSHLKPILAIKTAE